MAALFRREPIRPEFVVPPAETRESAARRADIEEADRRLCALRVIPRAHRHSSWMKQVNDLLDWRLGGPPPPPMLRPSVPYAQGGPVR